VNVGYPWVIYFFTNMTMQEVTRLAEASHDANLGMGLAKTKYTSPASLPGKAGVITTTHFAGIRLCTEIGTLMNTFRQHGLMCMSAPHRWKMWWRYSRPCRSTATTLRVKTYWVCVWNRMAM
jgi:hypothetical protein